MNEGSPSIIPTGVGSLDAEVDIEVLRAVPKQFSIEDEHSANWLVRKITDARKYAEHVKAWADQELRRAEREEHTLMFLFGRQIEAWVRSELERLSTKRKSIALPAGTVGFRTIAQKLVIDDEAAVIQWAKTNLPAAVVTVERLSKTEINRLTEETGEIPEVGVHLERESQRFFIK